MAGVAGQERAKVLDRINRIHRIAWGGALPRQGRAASPLREGGGRLRPGGVLRQSQRCAKYSPSRLRRQPPLGGGNAPLGAREFDKRHATRAVDLRLATSLRRQPPLHCAARRHLIRAVRRALHCGSSRLVIAPQAHVAQAAFTLLATHGRGAVFREQVP